MNLIAKVGSACEWMPKCHECLHDVPIAVQVGADHACASGKAILCVQCLLAAVKLADAHIERNCDLAGMAGNE